MVCFTIYLQKADIISVDADAMHRKENNRVRSKTSQVTWVQVTCEVTWENRDRKPHKLLGIEDKAKWLAKLLDSR